MEELLQVGIISSIHGVHGQVKVFPTTSDVKRFDYLKEAVLKTDKEVINLKLSDVKYFKQFVIVKFEGYDRPEDIEKYKGMPIFVTRENALKLDEDEYYVADLYGITVYDDKGEKLGIISDVISTGSNDVYAVKCDDDREILLPAIKQCILDVDMANRKMIVHVMEGLLD